MLCFRKIISESLVFNSLIVSILKFFYSLELSDHVMRDDNSTLTKIFGNTSQFDTNGATTISTWLNCHQEISLIQRGL